MDELNAGDCHRLGNVIDNNADFFNTPSWLISESIFIGKSNAPSVTTSQPAVNFSNMSFTSASSTSNLEILPSLSFSCAACSSCYCRSRVFRSFRYLLSFLSCFVLASASTSFCIRAWLPVFGGGVAALASSSFLLGASLSTFGRSLLS
jgi:hypothetical protein